MTTRQDGADRTRTELLDAGLRLAGHMGLAQMSVNRIVTEAGVAKGSFFHHFGDRSGYLRALHRTFHDRMLAPLLNDLDNRPPGCDRLWYSAIDYLDAFLEQPGVRAVLLEARAEAAVLEEIHARNESLARRAEPDFAAMGWPHPLEGARLWIRLVAEAALIEFDSGAIQPEMRTALRHYLRCSPRPCTTPLESGSGQHKTGCRDTGPGGDRDVA
ncbi:TetR/AcrR family transcriptional regulator [Nocardia mexicana]|uniref:TetR family transcriptional regulator n=1 Tax=Nocardia mexicana TaxID=279262 RepID=A0A370GZF3_9NOCA|nr:TetR/AcrR family transcriptional regulator [Nocardia mexicana]RDI47183.1 TetR family transcriptional regulator [Nocardia mexicana]